MASVKALTERIQGTGTDVSVNNPKSGEAKYYKPRTPIVEPIGGARLDRFGRRGARSGGAEFTRSLELTPALVQK